MTREVLDLALEALGQMQAKANFECWNLDICDKAITAIKQARSAPVQERELAGFVMKDGIPVAAVFSEGSHAVSVDGFTWTAQPPAAPVQEPVAWGNLANWCLDSDRVLITDKTEAEKYHRDVYDLTPLYTTPPAAQRPVALPHRWVGLTDEEIEAADYITMTREDYEIYSINQDSVMDFARAIEAKLKGKNT